MAVPGFASRWNHRSRKEALELISPLEVRAHTKSPGATKKRVRLFTVCPSILCLKVGFEGLWFSRDRFPLMKVANVLGFSGFTQIQGGQIQSRQVTPQPRVTTALWNLCSETGATKECPDYTPDYTRLPATHLGWVRISSRWISSRKGSCAMEASIRLLSFHPTMAVCHK